MDQAKFLGRSYAYSFVSLNKKKGVFLTPGEFGCLDHLIPLQIDYQQIITLYGIKDCKSFIET